MLLIVTEQRITASIDENCLIIKPFQLCDIHPMTPCIVFIDMQFTSQGVFEWLAKRTRATLLWSTGNQLYDNSLGSLGESRHCMLSESDLSLDEFLSIFTPLYYSRLWDRNNSKVILSSYPVEWENHFLNNTILTIYSEISLIKKVNECNGLIFIFDPKLNIDTIVLRIAKEKCFLGHNNISCFLNINASGTFLLTFN